ncbi:MAG: PD-(D/E)XK nuclease family protein [Acidobacteriota bacterium]|nr:PD-(D/E)XK nuclease family protein [Acidobacteriota bacterium]
MTFERPLPAYLSPSRLQDFRACPRRFQHASIDRLPQPASYAATKGRLVHHVFEHLYQLPPEERTREAAHDLVTPACVAVLSDDVRADLEMDDDLESRLRAEADAIVESYFAMEDPREVDHQGVELRVTATIDDVPMLGILDRLDRDEEGNLVIVDYKTGSLPNRRYDSQTFANTELYAALCEAGLGERPTRIRLLYVAQGETLERPVTEPVLRARREAAAVSWQRITRYYDDGEFPATPSANACRFCAYRDVCRANGVPVPV